MFFFFNGSETPGIYTYGHTLSLPDALPIFGAPGADSTTPGISDRVDVAGDLSIDGATLDVVDRAGFAAGLYTVLTWGGTLTRSNGRLTLGYTPAGLPVRLQVLHDRINVLSTRSEEHTSELQSLMRISYAVFCLKKKKTTH